MSKENKQKRNSLFGGMNLKPKVKLHCVYNLALLILMVRENLRIWRTNWSKYIWFTGEKNILYLKTIIHILGLAGKNDTYTVLRTWQWEVLGKGNLMPNRVQAIIVTFRANSSRNISKIRVGWGIRVTDEMKLIW